nr:hypothetical protein [Ardenticatena sp.]
MPTTQTFVLRFWPEQDDESIQWRGVIIYVPTNEQRAVSSLEDAFMLIQQYLTAEMQPNKEENP